MQINLSSSFDKCWDVLPQVSRSFALCIKMLPKPIDNQIMVSYLIFRLIDTVEDSNIEKKSKKLYFQEIIRVFSKKLSQENLEEFKLKLLKNINCTYEKVLLEIIPLLHEAFFSFPHKIRKRILYWAKEMAKGMYKFQFSLIKTIEDQNKYSYYVAGVVGYLFTDLIYLNKKVTYSTYRRLLLYANHFGLALQKINILRDVAKDIYENRYYWPEELLKKYGIDYKKLFSVKYRKKAMRVAAELIIDTKKYLHDSIKYIMELPSKEVGLRLFCLIPLFMAIESFIKILQSNDLFNVNSIVKISREQVFEIVNFATSVASSNEKVVEWFNKKMIDLEKEVININKY
ncbi:MAG: squalene/phytoene synthase family protein [Candidatus Micrarchaeota archaeon]|nr:squalene/phytoene synthase family protein [Candidatus Micrarchaeota archaeon]